MAVGESLRSTLHSPYFARVSDPSKSGIGPRGKATLEGTPIPLQFGAPPLTKLSALVESVSSAIAARKLDFVLPIKPGFAAESVPTCPGSTDGQLTHGRFRHLRRVGMSRTRTTPMPDASILLVILPYARARRCSVPPHACECPPVTSIG